MYVDSVGSSFFIISFVNVEHNSGLTKELNERFPSEKPFTIRGGLHYFGLAKRIHSDFCEQFCLRKGIVKAAAV
jgi:hypothetical protein